MQKSTIRDFQALSNHEPASGIKMLICHVKHVSNPIEFLILSSRPLYIFKTFNPFIY